MMNIIRLIVSFFLIFLCQSHGEWKQETAIVSKQKNETVVKRIDGEAVLFKHQSVKSFMVMANHQKTINRGPTLQYMTK